jgi:lipopolysaccharide transport system permease protein
MKLDANQIDDWEWEIKPSVGWFDFSIKKIFNHANLIWSFTKRDLQSSHKQTVLGNFWLIFQPLITTIVYTLVFANIIKVSTDGMPPLLFYLTGNMLWSFLRIVCSAHYTPSGQMPIFYQKFTFPESFYR